MPTLCRGAVPWLSARAVQVYESVLSVCPRPPTRNPCPCSDDEPPRPAPSRPRTRVPAPTSGVHHALHPHSQAHPTRPACPITLSCRPCPGPASLWSRPKVDEDSTLRRRTPSSHPRIGRRPTRTRSTSRPARKANVPVPRRAAWAVRIPYPRSRSPLLPPSRDLFAWSRPRHR
ncbi:hypothetical protein B0H14DRAFT_3648956, partial [Mycena olivaceomarginata]